MKKVQIKLHSFVNKFFKYVESRGRYSDEYNLIEKEIINRRSNKYEAG